MSASERAPVARDGDLLVVGVADDTGRVLVLGGSDQLAVGEVVAEVAPAVVQRLVAASGAAGHGFTATQLLSGRWVQLTQESAARLAAAGPSLDKAGVPMAVLRSESSAFSHVLRFESLGAAPMAASSMVGGLAIQFALQDIERQLAALSEQVDVLVEGSRIELEAELAAALDVIRRIERRLDARGELDASDWSALAEIEPDVKKAYHQVTRWLQPLREALDDDSRSMSRQIRALRRDLDVRDVDFWLRMLVYAELALKRWEALYLLHELQFAPEHAQVEGQRLVDQATERQTMLADLHAAIAAYLDRDDHLGRLARLRFLSRRELRQLHSRLAEVHDAYAAAMHTAAIDVPEYMPEPNPDPDDPGSRVPSIDDLRANAAEQARRLGRGAAGALERPRDVGNELGSWLRGRRDEVRDRIRDPGDDPDR